MRRGGHDPEKVFAAYQKTTELRNGRPTVILAKTIKGYGLGEVGEGKNIAHNKKKANEEELREFRSRFGIPISDEEVAKAPFYRPPDDSVEMKLPAGATDRAGRICPQSTDGASPHRGAATGGIPRIPGGQRREANVHDHGLRAAAE